MALQNQRDNKAERRCVSERGAGDSDRFVFRRITPEVYYTSESVVTKQNAPDISTSFFLPTSMIERCRF